MRMTPINRLGAWGALCLLLATGCSIRVADLTLVSTKNIDLSQLKLDARNGKRVKGQHCVFNLAGLPNLEVAIDRALENGGGNVMIDQVSYQKAYPFVTCIEVEGTVLRTEASDS